MMSNGLVAFIAALGAGGWVYMKALRKSGGNAKSSFVGAALVGVIVFIIMLSLLAMFDKYLQK